MSSMGSNRVVPLQVLRTLERYASEEKPLSNLQIIAQHVLPNCLAPVIVQTTFRMGSAIVSAASLSFLGLGVPLPAPEWGAMLSAGRNYILGYSYMTLFPGLALLLTVIAFNLVGDSLRDALDPKLKH